MNFHASRFGLAFAKSEPGNFTSFLYQLNEIIGYIGSKCIGFNHSTACRLARVEDQSEKRNQHSDGYYSKKSSQDGAKKIKGEFTTMVFQVAKNP